MRILELKVSGFKSLKNAIWEPGSLNVIIGANGSGKSNLLRLLELISKSASGNLSKYIQKSGGMDSLVWDGISDSISVSLKCSPPDDKKGRIRDGITYILDLNRIGWTSAYKISKEQLADYYQVSQGFKEEPFKYLERFGLRAKIFDENEHGLVAPEESVMEEETFLSVSAGPYAQNTIVPQLQKYFMGWCIYHDLHVNQDAEIRKDAVARQDKRVDADGQNLIQVLHTLYNGDRDFKRDINYAMRAAFGDDFEELVFPPSSDNRIQLRVRWKSLKREQSASDLSDGTLRFLFLLTVLASPTPASLIAIDEPETGLHPAMLPIVAEYAVEAAQRTQVILTTHSPQFLDAFREDRPTATVAKWISGESKFKVIEGKELENWLKEYSLGSLFESGELEEMT